jgi:UDP-N-acetylmuramate--alanine ligase
LGIFQPHLFSRTRDFAEEFAESLSLLDELILLEIYPAREMPMQGVNSQLIASRVTLDSVMVSSREELGEKVLASDASIVLTLGAGDIDQLIEPLKILLETKYLNLNA